MTETTDGFTAHDLGVIQPGEPRKWPEMMGVCYDDCGATPMTDTIEVSRELLERACLNLDAVAYYQFGAPLTPDDATRRGIADELRALLTKPASAPDEVHRDAERYRWLRDEALVDARRLLSACAAYAVKMEPMSAKCLTQIDEWLEAHQALAAHKAGGGKS